jgi:hypothetical protein
MPARLAAALGLVCLLAAGSANAGTVVSETFGQNVMTIQSDDNTHQGSLLVNGQPVIQNPNGAVGIDGFFATPDKLYILADIGETANCYHYRIVTLTGQQSTVSPEFGNCDYASGQLIKGGILQISLRSTAALATLKASATRTYDGQNLH